MRSMARVPGAAILIACIVAHTLPCLCGHYILISYIKRSGIVDFGAGHPNQRVSRLVPGGQPEHFLAFADIKLRHNMPKLQIF